MPGKSFLQNITKGATGTLTKAFHNPYREVNIGWAKLKILKHLNDGKLSHHILFGKKLYFYNPAELLHGLKEIFIEKCYEQHLPENPFIIDCGANIGLSIIYIKRIFPEAEIIAFEPDEKNFKLLEMNVNSYSFNKITLHKAAAWINNEPQQFTVTGTMGSSITTEKTSDSITVNAMKLKDIINRKVDFLKIDIEGAEFEVLKDIEPQLHFVTNLFIEYHGTYHQNHELLEILSIINKCGFEFYIKEAASIYDRPFIDSKNPAWNFDLQLNIFCKRK
jgi:FkbM family methyltransferase